MLLATSAIQAAAFVLFAPARMAFTAELVDARDLTNAVSLGQMSAEGMRVRGAVDRRRAAGRGRGRREGEFLGCAGCA